MVDAPFHAISTLALASLSLALQIQVGGEDHILKGQNITVSLIHDEEDPTDVFLKKHRLGNSSNIDIDVIKVTDFTANTTVNITFNHSDKYEIFAYGNETIDSPGKNAIATSDVFEVHNSDKGASSHHSPHGSDKGLIVGAVLGSTALIIITLLTIYLIFFRSRRRQRFQDRLVRNSDTSASSFVQYLYAKYPPGRKSGSTSYRDSPPPVYARSSPTSAHISLVRSMTTNSTLSSSTTLQHKPLTDRQMEIQDRLHCLQEKLLKLEDASRVIQGDIEAAENEAEILDTKATIGMLKDFLESPWAFNATDVMPSEISPFFTS